MEKLDYLQSSKLLQNIFFSLSKPLMHQGGHFDVLLLLLYAVGALDVQPRRRSGTAPVLLTEMTPSCFIAWILADQIQL